MHISADSNSLKATETIPSGCLCSRGVEREGEASRAEESEQGVGETNTVITACRCVCKHIESLTVLDYNVLEAM